MRQILQHRLRHDLTLPIRTIRLQPRRLRDGNLRRRAVDGRGGGVDEFGAVEVGHDLKEEDGGGDIVVVVG